MLADTLASGSRMVMNTVRPAGRRLISISWPSTQTVPSRSIQPRTAAVTRRSGCGCSRDDSNPTPESLGDGRTTVRRVRSSRHLDSGA